MHVPASLLHSHMFLNLFIHAAVCIPSCANGGTCTGPNDCQCASGWSGIDCQTRKDFFIYYAYMHINCLCQTVSPLFIHAAVCIPSCANGRTCTGPNDCQCASGWGGLDCETRED